jgi:hypothetical protein
VDFEARLRRIEDRFAIQAIKGLYAECADLKYTNDHRRKPQAEIDRMAERQASVFTEDAVWDGGPQFGRQQGRPEIYANLRAGPWSFAIHYFSPLRIDLSADEAEGVWSLWQVGTLSKGEQSVLLSAITKDHYIRTADGWRIRQMMFTLKFMTPFNQPWSARRNEPFTV